MNKNKKIINYGSQFIDDADIEAVVGVLKSNYLTQGPKINEFEEDFCKVAKAKYAVAVSNGTAALHISLLALDLPEGSEVITTPNSFVATANSILYSNLTPIFCDIDASTGNIDVTEIEKKITAKTKAIIPVHFSGLACDMKKIKQLATKYKLKIIEDSCHALGTTYRKTMIGQCYYSDMTVFSFHPVKTITTGEGGLITTNNKKIYEKLKLLRAHGITKDTDKLVEPSEGSWYYEMQILGFNYRMTDFQAALGIAQLKKLPEFIKRRIQIIEKYRKAFANNKYVKMLIEAKNEITSFHLAVVLIDYEGIKKTRTEVMESLSNLGINTQVHYIPIYKQPYYKKKFKFNSDDYPNTEEYYKKSLSLPLYPSLSDEDVDFVISSINMLVK